MELGVGLERCIEGHLIGEAQLVHDGQHLSLVAGDFVEADLVDLRGGFIQRGGLADAEGVVGSAVGQGRDAGIGAAVGDVGYGEELGESLVGGENLCGDGFEEVPGDALAVCGGDGRGDFFQRQREWAVGGLLGGNLLGLDEGLLHKELRRRAVVVQAGLQVGHDLREGDGNLVEACDVVVVVGGVVEGGVRGELGQVEL